MLPRTQHAQRMCVGAISARAKYRWQSKDSTRERHKRRVLNNVARREKKRGVLLIRDVGQKTMQGDKQIRIHKIGKNSVIQGAA
jgi:hypothetical protein